MATNKNIFTHEERIQSRTIKASLNIFPKESKNLRQA
jgi:hypothetical protein